MNGLKKRMEKSIKLKTEDIRCLGGERLVFNV